MLENLLIEKCNNGDGEAFRQLMKPYKAKLYGYLYRFAGSQTTAEEMFQETLIKVWNAFSRYNERQKFSSWLFTIAHNVAIDILRKRKNMNKETGFGDYEKGENENNPEELLIRDETMMMISKAVENLSEKQKAVFMLRQHGDLSFKEIAEATGEPLNTVLSHMRYAIRKVRKIIEDKNEYRKTATL